MLNKQVDDPDLAGALPQWCGESPNSKGELTTITFIVIDDGGMALASHASREGAIGAANNRVETALSFLVKQSRQRAA